MRNVQVLFPSGREVLNSYWGFLQHGGLVLSEPRDLREGDALVLDVKIRSLKQSYQFAASVVRRAPDGERAFVAFDEGQDQEVMLNAAWADTHEVPQRKHRRFPVTSEVRYAAADKPEASGHGRLMNLSRGGCCLKGTLALAVGTRVRLQAGDFELFGKVRWVTPAGEMGIEFVAPVADELFKQSA
jgi:Tfp pilus assembly protein PilZ